MKEAFLGLSSFPVYPNEAKNHDIWGSWALGGQRVRNSDVPAVTALPQHVSLAMLDTRCTGFETMGHVSTIPDTQLSTEQRIAKNIQSMKGKLGSRSGGAVWDADGFKNFFVRECLPFRKWLGQLSLQLITMPIIVLADELRGLSSIDGVLACPYYS